MTDVKSSSKTLNGLQAGAEVLRDQWGVPHIRATTTYDTFFLNGYVHAEDRMWQMETALRRGLGRFAEWAGPTAVEADKLARRLDVEKASRRDFKIADDATKAMCQAYADGVNAFIDEGGSAPEYAVLETTPNRWEPWHCIAVMRQRGLLMGSIWFKLWRAAAVGTIGPEHINLLRYDDGGVERFVCPQDKQGSRWMAALKELEPSLKALAETAPVDGDSGGSNNWAVSGAHTHHGYPLLAGDPHRHFEMPNLYAQLHLKGPDFDTLGFSVPGVPAFPHFGHNENVAWCVTHSFADLHDLYIEKFSEDGGQVLTADGWTDCETRTETISVRGAPDQQVEITVTPHGPLIVGDTKSGSGLTLKSTQLYQEDRSFACLTPMMKAQSLHAFYDAGEGWGLIDHNLVGADREGHIGTLVRATVAVRGRENGWLPVPGWTGTHEWEGMIPFSRMPREMDPASGRIATANNRVVPDDHPDYLSTDCISSTRVNRVVEKLDRLSKMTVSDMTDILFDASSTRAKDICKSLLVVTPATPAEAELLQFLAGWDGNMDAGLVAPTVYTLIRQEMTRVFATLSGLSKAADSSFMKVSPGIPVVNQMWWALPKLLRQDNTTLLGGKSWADVMATAVRTVATLPRAERMAIWGDVHKPKLPHPLGHMFPDASAMKPLISAPTGGDGDCIQANSATTATGLSAVSGPVVRYIFDLGNWDNSRWIVFHGTSGHAGNPHFGDQNILWANGRMTAAPYSKQAVDAHCVQHTRFNGAQ